jgi:hypothetical protein
MCFISSDCKGLFYIIIFEQNHGLVKILLLLGPMNIPRFEIASFCLLRVLSLLLIVSLSTVPIYLVSSLGPHRAGSCNVYLYPCKPQDRTERNSNKKKKL